MILKKLKFAEWILLLFPLIIILGPLAINVTLFLSIFFVAYKIRKKFIQLKEIWIFYFILFILYNIFRGFHAINAEAALISSFSLLKFISISLFFFLYIANIKNLNYILKIWSIIFCFVVLNTIVQYFYGQDFFGIERQKTRLTAIFNRQVVGGYLTHISIPIFFHFFSRYKNYDFKYKILIFLIYFCSLFAISVSGERLPLVIFLSGSLLCFFLFLKFRNFLLIFFIILFLNLFLFYFSPLFNQRIIALYYSILEFPISPWGRLFYSGYLVFDSNMLFGVGLKNYNIFCVTQIKDPFESLNLPAFCSTHPHNTYLEVLSETGLIGFLLLFLAFFNFFILSIKKYNKLRSNKIFNEYKGLFYGNIYILLVYLFPIKTAGRFFTTFNGTFFWLSLGIVLLLTKNKNYTLKE